MNPTDPTNERFEIAPLVWTKICHGVYVAHTIFGSVTVAWHEIMHSGWLVYCEGKCMDETHATLEAAQRAAEQWYRERLLPALVRVEA
jgi:hypothetical protein